MQGLLSIEGQAMSQTENSWSAGITMLDSTGLESRPSDATFRSSRLGPASRVATICQVLHGLNMGGAEVLAARLARQLREQYRFLFVCLDELGTLGAELRDEGFPVTCPGSGTWPEPEVFAEARRDRSW